MNMIFLLNGIHLMNAIYHAVRLVLKVFLEPTTLSGRMGVKERKERERQRRCYDILEAAHRQFESKGFLNTTLQDVAKEAEISVGLIYRYFQSKEDIFASLALKGAEEFDKKVDLILRKGRKKRAATTALNEIANLFFNFYGPYGEYFDMLMYSYKGLKEVHIHSTTLTRLMSVTLSTLEKLKNFILHSSEFKAKDEDEALRVVFLLWGILLGCHKLFDSSGRGHLFAFRQEDFIRGLIDQVMQGIAETGGDIPLASMARQTEKLPVFAE